MRRLRSIPLLLTGGGTLLLIVTIIMMVAAVAAVNRIIPEPDPTTPPSAEGTDPEPSESPSTCATETHWLALTSKHKESKYAYGNPVEAREWSDVLDALRTYVYQDPAGAGSTTAMFDGVSPNKVANRAENYVDDHAMWCQEVDRMLETAASAEFSIEPIEAGSWSLYQVPNPDGDVPVEIRQGETTESGEAAVFRFDGRTVKLRLDCHFQPVRTNQFPDVPHVPGHSSPNPSATPTPTHEATSPPSSNQPATHAPKCKYGVNANGDCKKSTTSSDTRKAGDHPKAKVTSTPPATPLPVQNHRPTVKATAPPADSGSSTGSGSSGTSSTAPNEGGGTNGGNAGKP